MIAFLRWPLKLGDLCVSIEKCSNGKKTDRHFFKYIFYINSNWSIFINFFYQFKATFVPFGVGYLVKRKKSTKLTLSLLLRNISFL